MSESAAPPPDDVVKWRPSPPEQEEAEPRRVRLWPRVAFGVGVLLAVLIAAGAISSAVSGKRARDELAALEGRLDETDPKWRREELEDAREQIPDDENSARVIVTVVAMLGKWPPNDLHEAFADLPPDRALDPAQVARLEGELRPLAAAVANARRLADMPRGRYTVRHAYNPYATLLPDHQEARRVGSLLDFDARRLSNAGDADAALRSCRGIVNAGRSFGDEPIFISALIRCALIAIAGNAIERTLAQGAAGEKELALLQGLLAKEDAHRTLRIASRGERASAYDAMRKMANGSIPAAEVEVLADGRNRDPWARLLGRRVGRRDPIMTLEIMNRVVAVSDLPEADQLAAERRIEHDINGLGSEATYTRMLVPAITRISQAIRRKNAYVRCLMVLVAAERYRLANGRWPADVAALTPGLLKAVPSDPYDGKPLRLRAGDGVVAYSVGEDLADNGGNLNRTRPQEPGSDLGYRLWDVAKRRRPNDAVLPPPEQEREP